MLIPIPIPILHSHADADVDVDVDVDPCSFLAVPKAISEESVRNQWLYEEIFSEMRRSAYQKDRIFCYGDDGDAGGRPN